MKIRREEKEWLFLLVIASFFVAVGVAMHQFIF